MHELIIKELDREAKSARLLLQALPAEREDWRPRPKSKTLAELGWHMASLPLVVSGAIQAEVRDRTKMAWPARPEKMADFAQGFDHNLAECKSNLALLSETDLQGPFRMMFGDQQLFSTTRGEFLRFGLFWLIIGHNWDCICAC